MFNFKTIDTYSEGNFIDKGSKFPSFAFEVYSVEDIKIAMNKIKVTHPKATHHCYAYKLGLDNNHTRVNDDGEPSGSAGRPILGQIHSNEITNVLIIVVRYYGGTKLGVSGLINAYKKSAQDALNNSKILEKEIQSFYQIQTDYLKINDLLNFLKKQKVSNLEQTFTENCTVKFNVNKANIEFMNTWLTKNSFIFTVKD